MQSATIKKAKVAISTSSGIVQETLLACDTQIDFSRRSAVSEPVSDEDLLHLTPKEIAKQRHLSMEQARNLKRMLQLRNIRSSPIVASNPSSSPTAASGTAASSHVGSSSAPAPAFNASGGGWGAAKAVSSSAAGWGQQSSNSSSAPFTASEHSWQHDTNFETSAEEPPPDPLSLLQRSMFNIAEFSAALEQAKNKSCIPTFGERKKRLLFLGL
jgi:hypothetical protein